MRNAGDFKAEVEFATAKNFIEWYNRSVGRQLTFTCRPAEAPDFIFRDTVGEIGLEITTVYYDQKHARIAAETARERRKAYTKQEFIENPALEMHWVAAPESKLIASINQRLIRKCRNNYGANCVLVVRIVSAALTDAYEFETVVVAHVRAPAKHCFLKIFLTQNQEDFFAVNECEARNGEL